MKAIVKTIFISTLLSIWTVLPVNAAEETFDRNGNGRVSVREVRKQLKEGTLDLDKTCLDEYGRRSRNLMIAAGITPPATAGVGVAAAYGAIWATAAGTVATAGLGAIILAIFAGFVTIAAFAVGLVTFETLHIVRLIKNNKLIKFIAEAWDGKGKTLNKYFKRFKKKYRRNGTLTVAQFAEAVVAADNSGAFCDGSLRGRGPEAKLRKRLARKKDILRHVNKQLQK